MFYIIQDITLTTIQSGFIYICPYSAFSVVVHLSFLFSSKRSSFFLHHNTLLLDVDLLIVNYLSLCSFKKIAALVLVLTDGV